MPKQVSLRELTEHEKCEIHIVTLCAKIGETTLPRKLESSII
jgi:hypothetical protein